MKLTSLLLASHATTTTTAQFAAQINLLENSPINVELPPIDVEKRQLSFPDNIPERQLSEPLKQAVEGAGIKR